MKRDLDSNQEQIDEVRLDVFKDGSVPPRLEMLAGRLVVEPRAGCAGF